MKRIAVMLFTMLFASQIHAASFDCSKALSNVEQLICKSQEISKLDEDLNKTYRLALNRNKDRETVAMEQRKWLDEIRNQCSDALCLKRVYADRISKLSSSSAAQRTLRGRLKHARKHAVPNPEQRYKFEPFIKEREFSDDPYEIASPEAEELLKFIEKRSLSEKVPEAIKENHVNWTKDFIAYLREGNGDFLKVSKGVYIVQSYFQKAYLSGIYVADMHAAEFKELARGYNLGVSESGTLEDGTGWLLAPYGGLTRGELVVGFSLITFFNSDGSTYVTSISPVGISRDYENECVDNVEHERKDTNQDGQNQLIINVEACDQSGRHNKVRYVFSVSKGHISELH